MRLLDWLQLSLQGQGAADAAHRGAPGSLRDPRLRLAATRGQAPAPAPESATQNQPTDTTKLTVRRRNRGPGHRRQSVEQLKV